MNLQRCSLNEREKILTSALLAIASAEKQEKYGPMVVSFMKYCQDNNRDFAGPITPQHSVELMMKVVERATVEEYGGKFVSQYGNNIWL